MSVVTYTDRLYFLHSEKILQIAIIIEVLNFWPKLNHAGLKVVQMKCLIYFLINILMLIDFIPIVVKSVFYWLFDRRLFAIL